MDRIEREQERLTRRAFVKAAGALATGLATSLAIPGHASAQGVVTQTQGGAAKRMNRAALEGIELEYEVRGSGEPVVLMHAGVLADWFRPLLDEPALAGRYRLVRYHRVGYGGSSRIAGPVSIAQQAAHLRSLMLHLGIVRAHIVGHSSSGNMAVQFALDAPDMTQSLALLEPALLTVPSGPQVAKAVLVPAMERYRAGDKAGAVDIFMRGVTGPAYRAFLDQALPGAFDQAVADADTFLARNCLRCASGHSPARMRGASPDRSLLSWGRRATKPDLRAGKSRESSQSDRNCCSLGCQTWSLSFCPTRRTFYTCRILAAWPRLWPPSLRVTRLERDVERCGDPPV